MNGLAYVFLRADGAPLPPGCGGHVGWGFLATDDGGQRTFYCGSTENPSGAFVVVPGHDNGWWGKAAASEEEMIALFRARDYDSYKVATVRNCDPAKARETADESRAWGYTGLGNNCLDHAWRILAAYGEPGLPFTQTHPSPNDWYAVYNGELHNIIR